MPTDAISELPAIIQPNTPIQISSAASNIIVTNPAGFYICGTATTPIVTTSTTIPTYALHGWTTSSSTTIATTNTNFFFVGSGPYYVTTDGTNWNVTHTSSNIKTKRGPLIKKSIRNSIKRALSLFSNFGMEEDARIFLGGASIEVSHPESLFKFVISKDRNLVQYTEHPGYSSPYKLELYTKSDVLVANLCVYMDTTPMLDQLFALTMFIKTGNEQAILEKANFRMLSSDIEMREILALEYPYLKKKLGLDAKSHAIFTDSNASRFTVTPGRIESSVIQCGVV